jgi:uncharacterized protein YoxC
MSQNKPILIVEHCLSGLKPVNESDIVAKKDYILGGTFTEFNIRNRNDRIYTADKFLPHLDEMLERKKSLGIIYGEFDHPDVFDTSLARVSHTVENAWFNKENNRVEGEIRLLNTHWGKEARSLVDDNCPIFVSSRAAGITESNGTVTVKKLFTYDCVADPGFSSARMELKSLNESLGYNENVNFRIYDLGDESKFNDLLMDNKQNEFVTKQQMTEYSNYLKEQMETLKRVFADKRGGVDTKKMQEMAELYENMVAQQTKVTEYLDYLAETIQVVVNENTGLKQKTDDLEKHNDYLAENLEKSINYSNYLAEMIESNIDYSEYIAETLDKNIDFSEYIAEHVDQTIQYSEYLAENLDKAIDYTEYIAENLDNSIVYAEYIAENLDKSIDYGNYLAENLDNSIVYTEYIAENLDNNIAYAEYIAEHVDNNIAYAEYIAEHVDNNIAYSEYIAENLEDTQAYSNYIAEGLDNTIENLKGKKLNEQFNAPNMRQIEDVDRFYDKDDDENEVPAQQTAQTPAQPAAQTPAQATAQTEPGAQPTAQTEPGAQPTAQTEPEPTGAVAPAQDEIPGDVTGVENEPISDEQEIVPGMTVSVENRPAEVLAMNPNNGIVTLKFAENAEVAEFHESKVTIIGDKIYDSEDSLKKYVSNMVTEAKKRKAEETKQPEFLDFLTEKNKKAWFSLSVEDRGKVLTAINESKEVIYSEAQLLRVIQETLTVKKSREELLVEAVPNDLKPVWESLKQDNKDRIMSQSRMYGNLNTPQKMEAFWNSRGLEKYALITESKKVLNENVFVDNSKLTDEQVDRFISKLKNL